jgi:hypothetical protein
MKKLLLTGFLIASSTSISLRADSLLEAIELCNVEWVKTILAQTGHLDQEYKASILKTAKQIVHNAKNEVKAVKADGKLLLEAGFFLGGSSLILCAVGGQALLALNKGYDLDRDETHNVGIGSLALAGLLFTEGLRFAYKACRLSTASTYLEKAREVENLIYLKPAKAQ